MEANKILKADLLDIIFENRNKAYGAYELRSTYNRRVKKAVTVMSSVCLVFTAGILLANTVKTNVKPLIVSDDIYISSVEPEKPKEQPIVEPPKPKPVEVKTIAFTNPIIHPDDQVDKTGVPTNDDIKGIQISIFTNDIGVDGGVVAPPLNAGTGGVIEPKNNEPDYNKEIFIVQQQAKFPGGMEEWMKYLQRNLNTEIPLENGAPVGKYTVVVSFLVDRDGNVSEIHALNDPGFGTAAEAIRVIKRSKQWAPAMQNGNKVIYRQKQSITFVVNEG